MNRIPIYQLTFGLGDDGKPGLVFSSELQGFGGQSVLFAIPLIEPYHEPFDLIDTIEHQTIFFPFEMEGKYYELEAKINFPEFIFSIPGGNVQITFEADIEGYWPRYFFPFRRTLKKGYKYVGKENLIPKNHGFITLLPVDLFEMDELYLNRKGVFVGMTPNFGIDLNQNDQRKPG